LLSIASISLDTLSLFIVERLFKIEIASSLSFNSSIPPLILSTVALSSVIEETTLIEALNAGSLSNESEFEGSVFGSKLVLLDNRLT